MVTVWVTVPSPPAMATTRGTSRARRPAASLSSASVRVSYRGAPEAALRKACEASGQFRLRCAFGLAMIASPPEFAMSDALYLVPAQPRLKLVLVRPQIPPNTGNVARLCAVTGTPLHLVAPLGFSLTEKQLRRAGRDYWDKGHAATHASFEELVREGGLNGDNVHLFTSRGTRGLWETRFRPGDWLILGEEQEGLPPEALERFPDRWVRVPMIREPSARSLNLSTCAGVVLYEALRQCLEAGQFPG